RVGGRAGSLVFWAFLGAGAICLAVMLFFLFRAARGGARREARVTAASVDEAARDRFAEADRLAAAGDLTGAVRSLAGAVAAAHGTSALKQLAEALGHPTVTLQDGFTPDLGMHLLFVFTPRTGFTRDEARRLADYLAGGGVVVYAAEKGDLQLDATLHVDRQS